MLGIEPIRLDLSRFIETSSGNRISRECLILGSENVSVIGMDYETIMLADCVIRGDLRSKNLDAAGLASVDVGRYCLFREKSVIKPPVIACKENALLYGQIRIGNNVFIGQQSVVEASQIGSSVWIGKGCKIGNGSIVRTGCVIMDGTTVAPKSSLTSHTVYAGTPAQPISECQDCIEELITYVTFKAYHETIDWV